MLVYCGDIWGYTAYNKFFSFNFSVHFQMHYDTQIYNRMGPRQWRSNHFDTVNGEGYVANFLTILSLKYNLWLKDQKY